MGQNRERRNSPHNTVNQCLTKEQTQFNREWRKMSSTNGAGSTGHLHAEKKKNLGTNLTPFTKINSNWITDLHARHNNINFLENR